MARTIGLRRAGLAWLGCAALALTASTFSAFYAHAAPAAPATPAAPAAPAAAPAASSSSSTDMTEEEEHILHRHKMTDVELGRLRMLEIQSGAFHAAHAEAHSQEVIGPPLSDREKVMQVVNRMTFGLKPGQIQKILEDSAANNEKLEPYLAWAKKQLDVAKIDNKECESDVAKQFPWITMSTAELKKTYPYKNDSGGPNWTVVRDGLPKLVLYRAVNSNRQFEEVMCEFWRNHFCIDNSPQENKLRSWAAVRYEEDVIRKHAFGKFKNMLFASATHPAMLEYLDNGISKANSWNENYAREVMELHTLGADRGYNNYDVQELSKVLTGWTWDSHYEFTFKEKDHQPGFKNFLGMRIPQGYDGGEQALYALATHRNTADFISRKLCQYLVNDNPPQSLVSKVAGVFTQTEGDLPKVYWAILSSPEFVSRENYRAKFKTPFDFVVSELRATGAKIDDAEGTAKELAKMGMPVYDCQDPTGYYFKAESWMDSGVLTSRWDYSLHLMRGGISGAKPSDAFVNRYKAMKIDDELKSMVKELIGDDIGDRTRISLVKAANNNEQAEMLAILLGSPSFQQY